MILALLAGGYFLDYARISLFGNSEAYRRFLGILVIEVGVTLVVAMTLVIIFHVLAFGDDREEKK